MKTLNDYLDEQLKNPEFGKAYKKEVIKVKIKNIFDWIIEMFFIAFVLILAFCLIFIVLAGCIAIYYGVY